MAYNRKDGILEIKDESFKAHLLFVNGFIQREGIDFNKVFSLIVKYSFIWILFVIVALFDLELE